MNIASYIDHTVLKPETTLADIEKLCAEAVAQSFAAVCVPPYFVKAAKELTNGSNVKVATVIGFPFGYSATEAKLNEIEQAIADGADELDIVHNIAALRNGNHAYLHHEVKACTERAHKAGRSVKIIVESGILTDAELAKCCELYAPLGIDFMKTSTGYAQVGATVDAVKLMRRHLPDTIAIKASGGIRTFAFAKELIAAGATRLGCSASMEIVRESGLG
ncbi:MAG: deoxyribose-phosphate aldolase [Flavipsychrobacter sp.]|nr:deoxyribose-phosphate aldolase [Flavipsychrobacter sp.]